MKKLNGKQKQVVFIHLRSACRMCVCFALLWGRPYTTGKRQHETVFAGMCVWGNQILRLAGLYQEVC